MNDTLKFTLEFNIILQRLADLALSDHGKYYLKNLSHFENPQMLQEQLNLVTQLRDCLLYEESLPVQRFSDMRPSFKRLEAGASLLSDECLHLLSLLVMTRKLHYFLQKLNEKYPLLWQVLQPITELPSLEKEIQRVIDPSGEIRDNASQTLSKLRSSIRSTQNKIRSRLDNILQSMMKNGYAQDENLALREGRLTVPVKENFRGQLNGVVVDQSASGATMYMEPLDVIEMNTELRRLHASEKQEIERILLQLSREIGAYLPDIERNYQRAVDFDILYAKAQFSIQMDGYAAETVQDVPLHLKEARHPLLLNKLGKKKVVPIDLLMDEETRTLVITGPNAGGKTVALKTVGLLSLMHLHGLHIPAQLGSRIPFFCHVFADIGDKQSIDLDLSTFSSHISNLKSILDDADAHTLVLLDEIGSATDPAEGSALAMSILKELTDRGCFSIVTTHIGQLKVFANEEPGIQNGSMAFDQESLRPTYRFQAGLPGSSYAFEISERLGIDSEIIRQAKQYLGEDRGNLDDLILHLEKEEQKIRSLRKEAEIQDSKLKALIKLYEDRNRSVEKQEKSLQETWAREFREKLKEANAQIEYMVREIRETQAEKASIQKAKRLLDEKKESLKTIVPEKVPAKLKKDLKENDWIKWSGREGKGQIISTPDSSGRVLVAWGNLKLKVPLDQLLPAAPPESSKKMSVFTKIDSSQTTTHEIDLRGLTVDEAIASMETYLSNAAMTGFHEVRVIHGKGTGALRKAVGSRLKKHPLVKSQRLGNWNEGDTGVTVVQIK